MEFGFGLPTRGPLANKDDLKAIAQRGEALGFQYLLISDHIVIPKSFAAVYPYSKDGKPIFGDEWLEQLTAMAWLAAVTEKARLITSVMVVPHRSPVHTAKILSTIDVLSGGRVTLGCGAGWMREEFEALGAEPFDERGKVTDEYIRIFRELWTSDEPSFDGEYNSFSDIVFAPKPVQRPLPIWIGGESGPALRRAAALGDGWYPIGANPTFPLNTAESYAVRAKRLEELAEEAGRDPAAIDRGYCANWRDDAPPFEVEGGGRFLMTGTPAEVAADVDQLAELGVRHVMVNVLRDTVEETFAAMDRFCEEIRSLVRS